MHGFKNILVDWLVRVRPQRVFEWGPGLSTSLILEHCPGVDLVSIEHHEGYHEKALSAYGERAEIRHKTCTGRNSDYSTCIYDGPPVDLAFVDGRRRVECVLVALTHLRPGGVVILHDVCRSNYIRPLSHYVSILDVRSNTVVMRARN
jgi:predicted O-methyltransferase YrrM